MNAIMLCNVPNLDINHNHSFTFRDLRQQIDYFLSKKVMEFDDTKYHRVGNSIKIPIHFDDVNLMRCNYLLAQNHNQLSHRKTYFYFITNKEYVNSETTKLTLKLDVIQTYLFEIQFGQCYIERQHYNPYDSNGDLNIDILDRPENLEVGEYIVDNVQTIYDYNNKGGFIVASSTKLSKMRTSDGGGSGGSGESGGSSGGTSSNGVDGKPSAKIFRFLKGYEALGQYPYYGNGESFRTYGYGVTERSYPTEFNSMLPAPVSERKASEVLYDVMYNGFAVPLYNRMKADGVNMDNLKQNQFDAFLSLAYNGGLGAVTTSPMYRYFLSNPNDSRIGKEWVSWYTNGGLAGLVLRRQSEYNIYANGVYEYRPIAQVNQNGYITGIAVSDNNGNGYIPSSCKGSV